MPENARWSVISSAAHTPEIGTVIDDAMRSIEKESKRLKDILPKNFARHELDKRRLGDVVDLFLGHMWSFAFLAIVLVVAAVYDLTVSVCRMSDLRAVPAATVGALYLVGENTHAAVS